MLATHPSLIVVRSLGRIQLIEIADVDWFLGAGNYVEVHAGGRSVLHREPLNALVRRLDPAVFVRIHRSVVVRRTRICELRSAGRGYTLVVCGDRTFRLGRKYRTALAA